MLLIHVLAAGLCLFECDSMNKIEPQDDKIYLGYIMSMAHVLPDWRLKPLKDRTWDLLYLCIHSPEHCVLHMVTNQQIVVDDKQVCGRMSR